MPFSLVFVLLLFTGVFLWREPSTLIKTRQFKELIIACLLLGLSLSYGIDYAMDWHVLPNPNNLLYILKPVSESIEAFFQITG